MAGEESSTEFRNPMSIGLLLFPVILESFYLLFVLTLTLDRPDVLPAGLIVPVMLALLELSLIKSELIDRPGIIRISDDHLIMIYGNGKSKRLPWSSILWVEARRSNLLSNPEKKRGGQVKFKSQAMGRIPISFEIARALQNGYTKKVGIHTPSEEESSIGVKTSSGLEFDNSSKFAYHDVTVSLVAVQLVAISTLSIHAGTPLSWSIITFISGIIVMIGGTIIILALRPRWIFIDSGSITMHYWRYSIGIPLLDISKVNASTYWASTVYTNNRKMPFLVSQKVARHLTEHFET